MASNKYLDSLLIDSFIDIFQILSTSYLSKEEIAEIFLEKAKAITQSKHGFVNTLDRATGDMISRTLTKMMLKECNTEGEDRKIRFKKNKDGSYPSLWGHALNNLKSFYTNDVKKHKKYKGIPPGHVELNSFLTVPITSNDELIGQIAVANSIRKYSQRDIRAIEKLSELYALSLKLNESEEKIRSTSKKLENITENMHEGLWHIDDDAVTVYVNNSMADMLGYKKDEMIGRPVFDFLDEKNIIITKKHLELRKKGISGSSERIFINKSGDKVYVYLQSAPIFDNRGKYKGSIANVFDMTSSIKAQKKIRAEQKKYKDIFENSPAGILTLDVDGVVTTCNNACLRLFGLSRKDLVGKHFIKTGLFKLYEIPKYIKIFNDIKSGKKIDKIKISWVNNNGAETIGEFSFSMITENKKLKGVQIIIMDVSNEIKAKKALLESYKKIQNTLDGTINTLSSLLELKDPYTGSHQKNVAVLATEIAKELGMNKESQKMISTTAMVHDIGKISIPASILSKPTKLNDIEMAMIRSHPKLGYDIIKDIDFGFPVSKIILEHHERNDGSGYPNKLKKNEIIFEAKILAVADTIEAMISHRPYRPAYSKEKAIEVIIEGKGSLFDPEIVDACIKVLNKDDINII